MITERNVMVITVSTIWAGELSCVCVVAGLSGAMGGDDDVGSGEKETSGCLDPFLWTIWCGSV